MSSLGPLAVLYSDGSSQSVRGPDAPPARCVMNESLGTRLRAQREQQQVSLSTISEKLKIKLSLLEQLEDDRVAHWPKGIFGRAYLRDYARSIGMDPESVVREFQMLHPDTTPDPFAPKNGETAPDTAADVPQAGTRFRRLVSAALGAVPVFRQPVEPSHGSTPADSAPPPIQHAFAIAGPAGLAPPTAQPRIDTASYPEADISGPEPVAAPPEADAIAAFVPSEAGERRRGDRRALSLSTAADFCSRLGRALDGRDVTVLLADAARLLDAVGVVVWLWDSRNTSLRASVAHGYSDAVLASLPAVHPDESNAIAEAFRSGEACMVDGTESTTGAVVVPSLGPGGCVAVLALEVRHGGERSESVRAFATILAAQLGALLPSAQVEPSSA